MFYLEKGKWTGHVLKEYDFFAKQCCTGIVKKYCILTDKIENKFYVCKRIMQRLF